VSLLMWEWRARGGCRGAAAVEYSERCSGQAEWGALKNRPHIFGPVEAMLMYPWVVLNPPVGILVGWLLPACPGTSPPISQRAPWKSSMKICASSSDVATY